MMCMENVGEKMKKATRETTHFYVFGKAYFIFLLPVLV